MHRRIPPLVYQYRNRNLYIYIKYIYILSLVHPLVRQLRPLVRDDT